MRVPYRAKYTTALLFAVAVLWITELVPLAATAMLVPVVATLVGVTDVTTVLQPFANPIIALFMAGFLLADTMRRTGVDRRIALLILQRASHNPIYLMLTLMGITAFLCLWMSNTASASLMIPIALAIVARIPEDKLPQGYARAMVLAIAYSATIGGVGSALGTPPNILAMSFLNQYSDGQMTFVNWFAYGLPYVIIMLPIIWLYLLLSFRVNTWKLEARIDPAIYTDAIKHLGPMGNEQKTLLLVFVTIVALWLTESVHHIPPAISALAGVCVLFFARLIKEESLNSINWNALLTFGGGLAIGTLLVTTGVSDWLALQLIALTALPKFAVLLLVISVTVLIGAFISNTACAAMLIPVAIPLAQILNLDPRLLVTVIAIACSVDFALVTGTPPTMIAYSTGMFSAGDIFRRGAIIDLVGILILSFGVIWIWRWFGIVNF
jgi:sodium-dependent dicarboxylate transporter 2/3/5